MADLITNLPTDSSNPTNIENAAINMLFNSKSNNVRENIKPPPPPPNNRNNLNDKHKKPKQSSEKKTLMQELSKALFGTILFIILSQKMVDDLIKKNIPQFGSPFMCLILKSIAFLLIFYIYEKLFAR